MRETNYWPIVPFPKGPVKSDYDLILLGADSFGASFNLYSSRSPTLWGITCASQGVKSLCHYTSCSCSLVLTDCQGDPNEQLVEARLLSRPVCLQSPCSFHSPGSLTCTSPMMSSMTTSYWTTKSAMMPELEKADWSCSIGQKVIRTQVSPLSILEDGGESPSPV